MLEAEPALHPLEEPVAVAQVVHGVGSAAEAEPEQLDADDDEQGARDQRVDEEAVTE